MAKTITDQELSEKAEQEIFTPALQGAIKQAQDAKLPPSAILNGVVSAHLNMIVSLLGGYEAAAELVKGQMEHLRKLSNEQKK